MWNDSRLFNGGVVIQSVTGYTEILGKRDKLTRDWRRLHNEELYTLYSSLNIIRVIKLRRIRLVGYVACMGEREGAYMVLVEEPEEGDYLEDRSVDGRIILKWVFFYCFSLGFVRIWNEELK